MEIFVIATIIILFVMIIIETMTKNITEKLEKTLEINKTLISLYQNEQDKTDTLLRLIKHIRNQLSLMNLKDCPEEEKTNIPNEIIAWINKLEAIINDNYYKGE